MKTKHSVGGVNHCLVSCGWWCLFSPTLFYVTWNFLNSSDDARVYIYAPQDALIIRSSTGGGFIDGETEKVMDVQRRRPDFFIFLYLYLSAYFCLLFLAAASHVLHWTLSLSLPVWRGPSSEGSDLVTSQFVQLLDELARRCLTPDRYRHFTQVLGPSRSLSGVDSVDNAPVFDAFTSRAIALNAAVCVF